MTLMQNELTPMIQTLITFGTGLISVAVIRVAIGHMDEKVDDVGDRVTDLEREVRSTNDAKG
jgi:hypothetical protein